MSAYTDDRLRDIIEFLTDTITAVDNIAGGGASFTQSGTGATTRTFQSKARDTISVRDFGAVGDATNDDTAAFQLAINAAISTKSTLLIPAPNALGWWKITSTLLVPAGTPSGQNWLDIDARGLAYYDLRWRGGNSSSVFKLVGWHNASIHGLKIYIDNSQTGVIGFDMDTAAAAGSTGTVSFYDCSVNIATGASNVGWRLGHASAGGGDLSFIDWKNCFVAADIGAVPANSRGWLVEGANALNLNWFGGGAYYLAKAFTNVSEAGAAAGTGGGCQYFYGWGTSHNDVDFEQSNNATMCVYGGRMEHGKRLLNVPSASGHTVVILSGVEIDAYNNGSSAVINFDRPGTLIWDGVRVTGATPLDANFMNLGGFTGMGQLFMRGGAFEGAVRFWTNGGLWIENVRGVGLLDSNGQQLSFLPNRFLNAQSASYTAVLKDADQVVEINNASANAFTIPPNSTTLFPLETILEVHQRGAGATTVTAGLGVTLRGTAAMTQYTTSRWRQRVADEWVRVS